ncbi:hypothetical protein, partial [uncultured Roseobacter sp.]|uniref:hypothetical protein n=1 Tax=uncultured Roseobacter sp. TaxID=114847 RepID=UPI00262509B7
MGRHLILTVHGIGEQKAGETVDAIVGTAVSTMPDAEPVKIQSDKIDLPDRTFSRDGGQTPMFPIHIRRVRPEPEQDDTRDAVFAEVYWADKSPAPNGFFLTAFDLLRVILGLGYIAMDNVSNVGTRFAGFFVHMFTWILFAGIAAANGVLLIGVGLLALNLVVVPLEADAARWLFLVHGGVVVIIGVYFWDYKCTSFYRKVYVHSYLVRLFGGGMLVFGLAISIDPPPLKWSGPIVRKRRIKDGNQTTQ